MRTHRWHVVAPIASLAIVLGACTSDGEAQAADGIQPLGTVNAEVADEPEPKPDPDPVPTPTPGSEPDPESDPEPDPEPAEIDISVIPDEITDEYVEAVLVELEAIYAEAYALVRDEQELTIEIADRISSIFAESQIDPRYGEFMQLAEQPDLLRASDSIEPRTREVLDLLDESPTCLWVETLSDPSGLSPEPQEPGHTFVLMRIKDVERPVDVNPTPWVYERLRTPVVPSDENEIRREQPCSGE